MLRPLELHHSAVGARPQTVKAMKALEVRTETHVEKLGDGPGCQSVSARLLAGELLLLDDNDIETGSSEPVAGGGAGRTAPDNEDVVAGHSRWLRACLRRSPVPSSAEP